MKGVWGQRTEMVETCWAESLGSHRTGGLAYLVRGPCLDGNWREGRMCGHRHGWVVSKQEAGSESGKEGAVRNVGREEEL